MQSELFVSNQFEAIAAPDAQLQMWRQWLPAQKAHSLYHYLCETLAWTQPVITIAGKKIVTPRWQCWMGDEHASYTYSGMKFQPQPWDAEVFALKQKLEHDGAAQFNSVLVNWYRDGQDSVSWHADDEPELGQNPVIASVSLGTTRRFLMRPNQRQKSTKSLQVDLNHGDLLLMLGPTQHHWQHCLPKDAKVTAGRINLTFRMISAVK